MNNREMGTQWEGIAAQYLVKHGMRIVESNFRCRQGEIDLIGHHQGYLVFVEVKYRRTSHSGYALAAVDYRKMRRICRVADYYRYIHCLGDDVSVRYDVVAVQDGAVQWVQNAFQHIYTDR